VVSAVILSCPNSAPPVLALIHLLIGRRTLLARGSALAAPVSLLNYSGPVGKDTATIDFKQSIAETDDLRRGQYAKTLTFTLSTTTP